jgi:hypothetical protein
MREKTNLQSLLSTLVIGKQLMSVRLVVLVFIKAANGSASVAAGPKLNDFFYFLMSPPERIL